LHSRRLDFCLNKTCPGICVTAFGFESVAVTAVMHVSRNRWVATNLIMWVKQCHKPSPHSQSFIGGSFAISSHGWFMALFYPHECLKA
jgi:hypothetical protein